MTAATMRLMRKLFLFVLLTLSVAVYGRRISPEEATGIAKEFFNSASVSQQSAKTGVHRVQGRDPSDAGDAPFYVFNADGDKGFVIVSGDDRASKILGYSDSGRFDFDNVPPQLEWLLNTYAQEIDMLDKSNLSNDSEFGLNKADKAVIAPLITSKWGQGAPFNDQCPEFDGVTCSTGCVATAIAQIMNYQNWPDEGEGTHSYDLFDSILTWDFEHTSFNWNLMSDSYDDNNSPESRAEIAKLMYSVGVGCNMGYTTFGSGSSISFAKRALVENLKYDTEMEIIWRNHYSAESWNNTIYSELSSNRPVYIQGGDHAFVCDGYAGEEFFHFNWGWCGEMDGNYLFSALQVGEDCFLSEMMALIKVHKREGEKKPLTYDLICRGGIKYDSTKYDADLSILDACWNYTAYQLDGIYGLEVENNENEDRIFFPAYEIHAESPVSYPPGVSISGNYQYAFLSIIQDLPDGYYRIYPAYTMADMPLKRIKCVYGDVQDHINLHVSQNGESYVYSNPGPMYQPDIEFIDFHVVDEESNPVESIYAHESPVYFSYTLKNSSGVASTNCSYEILDENDNIIYTDNLLGPIEPYSWQMSGFQLHNVDIAPGDYHINVKNASGECLNTTSIKFSAIERKYDLAVSDIQYIIEDDKSEIIKFVLKNNADIDYKPILYMVATKDNTEVRRDSFTTDLKANSVYNYSLVEGGFTGNIEINFYEPYGQRINVEPFERFFNIPIFWLGFEYNGYELAKGESQYLIPIIDPEDATNKELEWESCDTNIAQVDQDGKVTAIAEGIAVITIKATDGSGVTGECNIVVSDGLGIADVSSDKSAYVRIFNMQGMQVYEGLYSEAKLVPDYYIISCNGKSLKVRVE